MALTKTKKMELIRLLRSSSKNILNNLNDLESLVKRKADEDINDDTDLLYEFEVNKFRKVHRIISELYSTNVDVILKHNKVFYDNIK